MYQITDGLKEVVRKKQNQYFIIKHSKNTNIIENVDDFKEDTNNFGFDPTSNGASHGLNCRRDPRTESCVA